MADTPDTAVQAQLQTGIQQFNQGQYYACHDTLEAIWMGAATAEKPFFQGILQFAVALHHLSNYNWRGAAILLGEGLHRLGAFAPAHREVDVDDLLDQGFAWMAALQQQGAENVDALAAALAAAGEDPILTPPQIRTESQR